MKKKWMRTLVGGLSISTALFVFQACYGTPQDFELDTLVKGKVVSSVDGQPISGIKIEITGTNQHQYTDDKGHFGIYVPRLEKITLHCQDVDGDKNGNYLSKDTTLVLPDKEVTDVVIKLRLVP